MMKVNKLQLFLILFFCFLGSLKAERPLSRSYVRSGLVFEDLVRYSGVFQNMAASKNVDIDYSLLRNVVSEYFWVRSQQTGSRVVGLPCYINNTFVSNPTSKDIGSVADESLGSLVDSIDASLDVESPVRDFSVMQDVWFFWVSSLSALKKKESDEIEIWHLALRAGMISVLIGVEELNIGNGDFFVKLVEQSGKEECDKLVLLAQEISRLDSSEDFNLLFASGDEFASYGGGMGCEKIDANKLAVRYAEVSKLIEKINQRASQSK